MLQKNSKKNEFNKRFGREKQDVYQLQQIEDFATTWYLGLDNYGDYPKYEKVNAIQSKYFRRHSHTFEMLTQTTPKNPNSLKIFPNMTQKKAIF
jgi:hypothetical protein